MARLPLFALLGACTGTPVGDTGGTPIPEGCEPDPASELAAACRCAVPSVEVGSGAMTFEAMEEGSPLTMVHGPQGGWHMLGSARFANLHPIVSIHYTIAIAADGTIVSDNNYRVQMVADGECGGYYPGMYGYLNVSELATVDADTPPELLADVPLVLTMAVTDDEGRTASDTLGVVAALDPVDVERDDSGRE